MAAKGPDRSFGPSKAAGLIAGDGQASGEKNRPQRVRPERTCDRIRSRCGQNGNSGQGAFSQGLGPYREIRDKLRPLEPDDGPIRPNSETDLLCRDRPGGRIRIGALRGTSLRSLSALTPIPPKGLWHPLQRGGLGR
jgi:hypothetical protein